MIRHTRLQGDWSSDVCSSDLAVPRRADRDAEVDPGEAAAGHPGRCGAARGQRDDRRGRERPLHRRDQHQSRAGGAVRVTARGPVLSAARGADPRPEPARASGRHSAPGRALPRALLDPASRPDDPGAEAQQGRALGARRARLARQRAGAAERDRACGRAARARGGSASRGHSLHRVRGDRSREAGGRGAGGRRGELLLRPRPPAGPVRPALPDARRDAGGRQPLESGAARTGRPHDVLPAHGAARPPTRPADRRRGVTVTRLTSTTTPEPETIAEAPPSLVRPRPTPPAPQPLAGVTCALLTAAIRRTEERWVSDHADDDDPDGIPRVLAAIGLAVDRRFPRYPLSLRPRPPPPVTPRPPPVGQSPRRSAKAP